MRSSVRWRYLSMASLVAAGVLAVGSLPAAAAGAPTYQVVPAAAATSGGGPASGGPGTAMCGGASGRHSMRQRSLTPSGRS